MTCSFFANTTVEHASIINKIVGEFFLALGAKVSLPNSKVYVSLKVSSSIARNISSILDIGLTSDLGKCLGVPLVHERVKKAYL